MDKNTAYLEFLRWSLDESAPLPTSVDNFDWSDLYMFSRKQTVETTMWKGIERLDLSHKLSLSETEVLTWMARIKKVERNNRMVYEKAAWVWNNFRREGFRSCLLKGQGNALLYPTPYMRIPGDIDICYSDPTKAKEELGWEAEFGIEEMCADAWRWQKNNPEGFR